MSKALRNARAKDAPARWRSAPTRTASREGERRDVAPLSEGPRELDSLAPCPPVSSMRDVDVRRVLRRELKNQHRGDGSLIIEELGICQGEVRIDVAVVNGSISGFEIKSDVDTLARLVPQMTAYNRILDYAHLVTGERHLEKALAILPAWWGVTTAHRQGRRVVLEPVRNAEPNAAPEARATVELLWREEALAELDARGLARGLSRASRTTLWDMLAAEVGPDELRAVVRERVKTRGYWRRRQTYAAPSPWWLELLPEST